MARYKNVIPLTIDIDQLRQDIEKYLISEGFNKIDSSVWKKGIGMMTAPQFISFYFSGNSIVIEAWLKYAILPGLYFGEMGIDGFFGALPKQLLKGRVLNIERNCR